MAEIINDNHLATLPPESNTHRSGAWYGPRTDSARTPITGEAFNALREKGNAERAGVAVGSTGTGLKQQSHFEMLSKELGPCAGLPRPAALALARELSNLIARATELEGKVAVLQQQLARQNPPHLAKSERRG